MRAKSPRLLSFERAKGLLILARVDDDAVLVWRLHGACEPFHDPPIGGDVPVARDTQNRVRDGGEHLSQLRAKAAKVGAARYRRFREVSRTAKDGNVHVVFPVRVPVATP
jgi:hypothetical protein